MPGWKDYFLSACENGELTSSLRSSPKRMGDPRQWPSGPLSALSFPNHLGHNLAVSVRPSSQARMNFGEQTLENYSSHANL